MVCPAFDDTAPISACYQRILELLSKAEILKCRQCVHGQRLMETCATGFPVLPITVEDEIQMEAAMPKDTERKTWTIRELSDAIGVFPNDVKNAKQKHVKGLEGSKVFRVREFMRENGITWNDVVPASAKTAEPKNEMPEPPAPPEPLQVQETPLPPPDAPSGHCESLQCLVEKVRKLLPTGTTLTISA